MLLLQSVLMSLHLRVAWIAAAAACHLYHLRSPKPAVALELQIYHINHPATSQSLTTQPSRSMFSIAAVMDAAATG